MQAPAEGLCGALILTLLPASLYAVIHWSLMSHWVHIWSFLLLASTPILFLSILKVRFTKSIPLDIILFLDVVKVDLKTPLKRYSIACILSLCMSEGDLWDFYL